jgi:thiol-disulfide isomerase/thioredoxin
MNRFSIMRIIAAPLACTILLVLSAAGSHALPDLSVPPRPLPELPAAGARAWLNSEPLSVAELRGSVVLIDVWATACIPCLRSAPWIHALDERYRQRGLRVVGIHAPQFAFEKNRERVAKYAEKFGMEHPIYLDDDLAYFGMLGTVQRPEIWLADRRGRLRAKVNGEMNDENPDSQALEAMVKQLLAESVN